MTVKSASPAIACNRARTKRPFPGSDGFGNSVLKLRVFTGLSTHNDLDNPAARDHPMYLYWTVKISIGYTQGQRTVKAWCGIPNAVQRHLVSNGSFPRVRVNTQTGSLRFSSVTV